MTGRFTILTIFPEFFDSFLGCSLIGKAVAAGRLAVDRIDIRDFAAGPHRRVDDAPYGGGAGMVMMPEPVVRALGAAPAGLKIMLTPQGRPLTQDLAREIAGHESVVLLCGRYEGFDDRIRRHVDLEVSLGDFVLQGGEVPAMALVECVVRLGEDVMGNPESAVEESFSGGLLEYPQYTRPRSFEGDDVPEVLLSGDHEAVRAWREKARRDRTRVRRPDMVPGGSLHLMLVHHPVLDQSGRIISTSVTNLDVHDLARAARTYGLASLAIVTPIEAQRTLVEHIIGYWSDPNHSRRAPGRREALSVVRIAADVESAIALAGGTVRPLVIGTSARPGAGRVTFRDMRSSMRREPDRPRIVLLGTGWGLAPEVLDACDAVLEPIDAASGYNHLSVRSAAAVVLDRLVGRG